ncbi:MAG: hypothetical protein D6B26_01415 [Spirochaetaceae bacterium]|nr:MAG: hypothetical protein D6B26_01415 [Spirochaetaceae bacterium]
MKKRLGVSLAIMLVLVAVVAGLFTACASPVELEPVFFYTALVQRSTMVEEYPEGFFQMGFMVAEKGGALLTADNYRRKIKSAVVTGPDGTEFAFDPYRQFDLTGKDNWNGYFIMGSGERHAAWVLADLSMNAANLPPEGVYTLELVSKSGHVSTYTAEFMLDRETQFVEFPQDLTFEQDERRLTWKGVSGLNVRYRVYIFAGDNQQEDWTKLVYASTPTGVNEAFHVIPDTIEFVAGEEYTVMIEAFSLPYFHIQDKPEEKLTFVAK